MTNTAKEFIRPSLAKEKGKLKDYGKKRLPASCDLSLVAGPFIWEEEIRSAFQHLPTELLREYPLPNQSPELLELLAAHENLEANWITLTPGADIAIEVVLRQILDPGDKIAILCPNFPRFEVVARTINGVIYSNHLSIDDIPTDAKLVAICTPCNPSTKEIPFKELQTLVASRPDTIFCIDGVFAWYSEDSLSELFREHSNIILIKSFSKLGLAGLRLGYIIASPELQEYLTLGQSPFSVSAPIQQAGINIAKNLSRLKEIKQILAQRWDKIYQALGTLTIRETPLPFYLLPTTTTSDRAASLLIDQGISVVPSSSFYGIPENYLRIAIGTDEQNSLLINKLHELRLI